MPNRLILSHAYVQACRRTSSLTQPPSDVAKFTSNSCESSPCLSQRAKISLILRSVAVVDDMVRNVARAHVVVYDLTNSPRTRKVTRCGDEMLCMIRGRYMDVAPECEKSSVSWRRLNRMCLISQMRLRCSYRPQTTVFQFHGSEVLEDAFDMQLRM